VPVEYVIGTAAIESAPFFKSITKKPMENFPLGFLAILLPPRTSEHYRIQPHIGNSVSKNGLQFLLTARNLKIVDRTHQTGRYCRTGVNCGSILSNGTPLVGHGESKT
jgi:hypothetical protein